MAFSDFTYPEVVQQFGLLWQTTVNLFAGVPGVPPSATFQQAIAVGGPLAVIVNTEKARSEWMVAPLLGDFWANYRGQISLFSGTDFQADPGSRLTGYCDFLIGRAPQQPQIIAPVVVICEAKKESVDDGLGQCIAGMVGAQRFNRRANTAGRCGLRVPDDRERMAVLAAHGLAPSRTTRWHMGFSRPTAFSAFSRTSSARRRRK